MPFQDDVLLAELAAARSIALAFMVSSTKPVLTNSLSLRPAWADWFNRTARAFSLKYTDLAAVNARSWTMDYFDYWRRRVKKDPASATTFVEYSEAPPADRLAFLDWRRASLIVRLREEFSKVKSAYMRQVIRAAARAYLGFLRQARERARGDFLLEL